MPSVDTKVVEMQFDNKQFESGIGQTLSSLDRLKRALSFGKETKNVNDLEKSVNSISLSAIEDALDVVKYRFSALGIAGATAIANITNSVMSLGYQMKTFLVTKPISDGFAEYETQMNAIQTILSNTRSEGTNIQQVNAALDELNAYADRTIYNFTEMTRNIGTFTAAGVDLNTSVNAIQGIANLAAVSGSTSNQASVAMYQLSQALATGTVKLMDWNSVVNAGMGGQVFQDALRKTSEELGTGAEAAIKAEGSFRESLSVGWLTSQVLTETLKKFTTSGAMEWVANYCDISQDAVQAAYDQAYAASTAEDSFGKQQEAIDSVSESLAEQTGKSRDAIKETLELAYDAQNAATKVKTFSQLIDTLGEALGSGWTKSWQLIIGDFEEARELWTKVSDVLSDMINTSSDARNAIIQGWADLGGRTAMIDGLWQAFYNLKTILGTISSAFRDVFPKATSEQLADASNKFKGLMDSLKPTEEVLDKLSRGFKGVFSILDIGKTALSSIFSGISGYFSNNEVSGAIDVFLTKFAELGDAIAKFDEAFKNGEAPKLISETLTSALTTVSSVIDGLLSKITGTNILSAVQTLFSNIGNAVKTGVSSILDWISDNVTLSNIFDMINTMAMTTMVVGIGEVIQKIKDKVSELAGAHGLIELLFGGKDGDAKKSTEDAKKDVGSILQAITGIDFSGISEKVSEAISSLSDALNALTMNVNAGTLVKIAVAVGVLTYSLKTLSEIHLGSMVQGLLGLGVVLKMLTSSMTSITGAIKGSSAKGMIAASVSMIVMAEAVKVLANVAKTLGSLNIGELAKGLVGLGVLMTELGLFMDNIKSVNITVKDAATIFVMAEAMKVLADAVLKFATLSWGELARGLIGAGAGIVELAVGLRILSGVEMKATTVLSIYVMAKAMTVLAEAVNTFATLSWEEIGRGLTAMGGALTELIASLAVLSKVGNVKSLIGTVSMDMLIDNLQTLANALRSFGTMAWDEIARGLTAMGGAFTELVAALGILGKVAGFESIFASKALSDVMDKLPILAEGFQKIGSMSWDEIGRGLVGMGGALGEIAGISGALGSFAGLSSIIGSLSIVETSKSLGDIADALIKIGQLSWDQIGVGLVGMGGALGEIAVVTGALGSFAGLASIIGSLSIVETSKSLGEIADALAKFGSMSWDEISRGLTAMAGALGETALGGALNTFGVFGAGVLQEIAEPLGVLADSVKKWSDVTLPEGLGTQLGDIASGVNAFWLSGMGSDAISTLAEPFGVLADSTKKWSGVTIPDGIGTGLGKIAEGVNALWMSGMGADAIAKLAQPFGTLALSVNRWAGVTIPENLGTTLSGLAGAIGAFTLSGLAADSISAVAEPFGNLADSVGKWSGLYIRQDLKERLTEISQGIQAFTLSAPGGMALGAITGPLGNLADAISKWGEVVVPDDIATKLTSISDGVRTFNDIAGATVGLQSTANALDQLGTSLPNLAGVDFNAVSNGITSISTAINSIPDMSASAQSAIDTIGSLSSAISDAASSLATDLTSSITSGFSGLNDSISAALSGCVETIADKSSMFSATGKNIIQTIADAFISNEGILSSQLQSALNSAKGMINTSAFYSLGRYLMLGLAKGMNANRRFVVNAARSAVLKAVEAANKAADVGSPSKVFAEIGMYCAKGLAIGMENNSKYAEDASESMMDSAIGMLSNTSSMAVLAAQSIQDAIDADYNPVIRPVLDDRQFKTDLASAINSTSMSARSQISLNASYISKGLAQENQNGFNEQILRSIAKLRKEVAEISKPTYNVGGITYDDGSNVATAVRELTRAVKVERRK